MSTTERVMPLPRLQLQRDDSGSSQSPRRRTPSPLRHAQFRPLAMEYANDPQPRSCKYFNKEDEEMEVTQSEFCAMVRTVGYSTVGDKNFMSGKCPHCHRQVKSERQVCTPNATPPPSPWKVALDNLQSPLRSPLRTRTISPKNGDGSGGQTKTTTTLQSPLRSPFKGSFFGSSSNDDDDATNMTPASPKKTAAGAAVGAASPAPARQARGVGLTRSPPRSPARGGGCAQGMGSPGPWARSRSPDPRANSPGPRANSRSPRTFGRGPLSPVPDGNSSGPSDDAFLGASDNIGSSSKPWASPSRTNVAMTGAAGATARSPRAERGRSPTVGTYGAEQAPLRDWAMSGGGSGSPSPQQSYSRSRSPAPASSSARSPVGGGRATRHSPGGTLARGPRSPGPRSPLRSPWKGASFFGDPQNNDDDVVGGDWVEETSAASVSRGSSGGGGSGRLSPGAPYGGARGALSPGPHGARGAHSPGPYGPSSPLRVKVDFFDERQREEEEEEAERSAAAAAALSSKQEKGGGWKSPIRSPFKGLFFGGGRSSKKHGNSDGKGTMGTE